MPPTPFVGISPLRFRGIPDSLAARQYHLEGSECCLIHADNPLSRTRGVFVNPAVRVGYNQRAYDAVHPKYGSGAGTSGSGSWLSLWQIWSGMWRNRVARWMTSPWFKERVVMGRLKRWMDEEKRTKDGEGEERKREEKGRFCLVNEMQVVVKNGWAHL